jgi:tol-pal system protein YbgF
MSLARACLPFAAVLLFLSAAPAMAQVSMDDPLDARDAKRVDRMEKVVRELRAIVFQAQKTGQPVVVQPADTDARMADLSAKIGDLEQALQRVNGSLDGANQQLNQAKRQNQALGDEIKTLEAWLAKVEAVQAAPPPPPPPPEGAAGGGGSGDPTADFAKARQLMLGGDYDAAEAAFASYVDAYPDGPKTPEARYWWGKTLSVKGDHTRAATAYIGAIRGWPQTSWAADGVVELARSLVALKKPTDACQALVELNRRYPKAPTPVKARADQIKTQAKCGT